MTVPQREPKTMRARTWGIRSLAVGIPTTQLIMARCISAPDTSRIAVRRKVHPSTVGLLAEKAAIAGEAKCVQSQAIPPKVVRATTPHVSVLIQSNQFGSLL